MSEKTETKTPKKEEKPKAKIKEKILKIKESEYLKLTEELAETKDKYLRLYAEFDNARKRMDREKSEFVKYANEELVVEFLVIMDGLEKSVEAASHNKDNISDFLKGIELVMSQIHDLLKKNGVTSIEATGKLFDPHCHEVLMQEETDEHEDGMVIEEFQRGYLLGDKVIRTTKVKVAKGK